MRLTILQDFLRIGGTERQTLHLAQHAAESGHEVTLIIFRPGGPLATQLTELSCRVEILQAWDTRVSLFAPKLAQVLDRARPEVVLCMGRTANCYAGWIQERRPHIAVVGTIRTGKVIFPWHQWSLSSVRAVLVNSRWWQRRLREWGLPVERIHVVHNSLLSGGLPMLSAEDRIRLRSAQGLAETDVILLQVASFRSGKRHADLLRSLAQLTREEGDPQWFLWLVGDGRERARCERLAASLGLSARVRFWGFQENPHQFYPAADIAVSVSAEDSLPNFLIEAQSNGVPLVASDYRGVREACLPGISGEITPRGDPVAFREQLLRLLRDPDLRRSMGTHARAFARERFSADRQADEVLEFLEAIK